MPKVSIILPTYNRANLLKHTIESVLAQSFTDWELIIVDDCSTDNTEKIVASFADPRVFYLRLGVNTGGSYSPRSIALRKATGEYVAVLDDDSTWLYRDKLKEQVTFLDKNLDHVLVGTNAVSVSKDGDGKFELDYPLNDTRIREKVLYKSCFPHPAVVYRRELVMSLGGYRMFSAHPKNPDKYYSNDYELWLRLGLHGKIANLPIYGVGIILEAANCGLVSRARFALRMLETIKEYKDYYPHYYLATISWLFNIMLDIPVLRFIKNEIIKSRLLHRSCQRELTIGRNKKDRECPKRREVK